MCLVLNAEMYLLSAIEKKKKKQGIVNKDRTYHRSLTDHRNQRNNRDENTLIVKPDFQSRILLN